MNGSAGHEEYEKLAQRVSQTVERENQSRRRALRVFLALLLIPLAAVVLVLVKGVSDTEWVRENARVAVAPDLKAVRQAADEVREALPEIRQAASKVEETSRRVDSVEVRQAEAIAEQQVRLSRIEEQQSVTIAQVRELAQAPMATRDPRVDALLERVRGLEHELQITRRDLSNMAERQPVTVPENLESRIRVIERRLEINR